MSKPFILFLSSSGGAGHIRAAQALERVAQEFSDRIRAEHHDCLDFTTPLFKKLYGGTYLQMVNRVPEIWGYLYSLSENNSLRKRLLSKIFDHFNYQRYLEWLGQMKPQAIVCTHFLPYRSVSESLRRSGITAPVFAATTDFDVHNYWVSPIVERYYVYHEESAWQLAAKGIRPEKIRVLGIPVSPEFELPTTKSRARRELGIAQDRFTLLVMSGGFGVGSMEELVLGAADVLGGAAGRKCTMLVVCGKNERLRLELERRTLPPNIEARIFGFVTNVHTLMAASDLLVSKAGGLTLAEALASRLPLIMVNPIPGQETRNADLVVEHQAGWKALNLSHFQYKLSQVLLEPELLPRAQLSTAQLAKPQAARKIVSDVLSFL